MDTATRLKTKIGEHEFEAEGSPEHVREQFQMWQELVKLASAAATPRNAESNGKSSDTATDEKPKNTIDVDTELVKIFRVDGRCVSLTARPTTAQDAVLMLLYGQKSLRSNDSVTGAELHGGLGDTGGFAVGRLDRIMDKLAADGDVMSFGERRGKKYRLTNTGVAKARALAKDLIATVA